MPVLGMLQQQQPEMPESQHCLLVLGWVVMAAVCLKLAVQLVLAAPERWPKFGLAETAGGLVVHLDCRSLQPIRALQGAGRQPEPIWFCSSG